MKKMHRLQGFVTGVLVTVLVAALAVPASAALTSDLINVWKGITIYVDGEVMQPTDANGKAVETFVYQGTTYVPLRAISQYLGKYVTYDSNTQSAYIGERPGTTQYLLDVCPPYQTDYYDEPVTITMAGQKYTKGFIGTRYYTNYALFNLNGQYSTLEFDVGHIDGQGMYDATLNVYLDGQLAFTKDLTSEMMPQHCSVPLNRALQMKIEVTNNAACYGIANITVK